SARLELGRVLIKCGRYVEAAAELALAARDPLIRAEALHESAVANYRAGAFHRAVADGAAAMTANPANERTRAFLWQSAQRIGGYPPEVPPGHRMGRKGGYATPPGQFEDIPAPIGLDKTTPGPGLAASD